MDELKARLEALRTTLVDVRAQVVRSANASTTLHVMDGGALMVDVLMLGSSLAGGLAVVEVALSGQIVLLEKCIAGRESQVESDALSQREHQN